MLTLADYSDASVYSPKLSEIFDEIWKTCQNVDESTEATNSETIQLLISRVLKKCEAAVEMVNILALFSTNEDIEEVATNEIKYMLLSALLGYFTMKKSSTAATRLAIVQKAKAYYLDYIRLCRSYNLAHTYVDDSDTPTDTLTDTQSHSQFSNTSSDITQLASVRAEKIRRFNQQKTDEQNLKDLHTAVNREHVDDEVKRDYYLALVKKFIDISIDDMDCIKTEIEMLKYMEQRTNQNVTVKEVPKKPAMRPFILTKTELQKQVFGAGYPALPSMTIEEFYQQKVRDGTFLIPSSSNSSMQDKAINPEKAREDDEHEAAVKEGKLDHDDPDTLQHQRACDDWKDDHRRGEGNRQNMG